MNQLIILTFFLIYSNLNAFATELNLSINGSYPIKNEPILPIPGIKITHPKIVNLGKKLFHDPRLSKNNTISCASCHPLSNAGVDHLPIAIGIDGLKGSRNTPTVYNSSLNFRQFWDGRVKSLEKQAIEPIINPVEMGANIQDVINKLSQDAEYQQQFDLLYTDGITINNIAHAIAEFEQTLLTPDSPFDLYLKGNKNAIDQNTKEGYQLFKSYGCSSCHQGVAVGGNMYEKLGVVIKYYPLFNKNKDLGRFKRTGLMNINMNLRFPV